MSFERTEVDGVFLVAPTSGASVLSVAGAGSVGSIGAAGADGERVLSLIGPMAIQPNQHQMARLALPSHTRAFFCLCVCVLGVESFVGFAVHLLNFWLAFQIILIHYLGSLEASRVKMKSNPPPSRCEHFEPAKKGGFVVVENFHFGSIFSGEPAGLVCGWVIDSRHRAFTTVPG